MPCCPVNHINGQQYHSAGKICVTVALAAHELLFV